MPLVTFASPKGGVGKTTLAANIADRLAHLGWRVVVVDFDLQNLLRLHFAIPLSHTDGLATPVLRNRSWPEICRLTPSGIAILPFGTITNNDNLRFQAFLRETPTWLPERLESLMRDPELLVIADTPPGPSPYLTEIEPLAAVKIAVLLSDAASIAQLPKIQAGQFYTDIGRPGAVPISYIINQVDLRRRLNRGVQDILKTKIGDEMLGTVHQDEAVAEAIACQQLVAEFAPGSGATEDYTVIAKRVDALLKMRQQARPHYFEMRGS